MNTIQKINDDHWIVDGDQHIRYSDSFGNTGWYWDADPNIVFPDCKRTFLEVLEEVIGEYGTPPRAQPRPAGM